MRHRYVKNQVSTDIGLDIPHLDMINRVLRRLASAGRRNNSVKLTVRGLCAQFHDEC